MNVPVLILDDELKLRKLLGRIIALEGYLVREAGTLAEARKILAEGGTGILLCDVRLPDGDGVDFCAEVRKAHPSVQVILLTAYGNIHDGVRAMKNGAFDYLVKGDDNDKIIPLLSQAAANISASSKESHPPGSSALKGFEQIIGSGKAIRDAVLLAQKVAPTEASVLLNGETGTGKEVFAQAIHGASARATGPFVALNCSSLSRELLESTLFGHKAGAFTSATKDKKGLIDEAAGGTLFLDEIGELPAELQPKLLRLLEDGSYYMVGDTRQRRASIRIISATNRSLQDEIAARTFRSDLFYRIATFTIALPPLRERVSDIPLLVSYFLKRIPSQGGKRILTISDAAQKILNAYHWNGNIRELKHVLERAVILEDSDQLTVESLPIELQQRVHEDATALAAVERSHILRILEKTGGNKAEAARLLGIGIATLYRKLAEYGL